MDKRWRILVVDDEPNNLQLIMQILSDRYQLAFAANGEKALEIAQKLETDMILLDIMMPGMDGYEVCKKLKMDEKTKGIPVIFVTAKDDVDDETRGLELGAIDYIAKPISPSIVKARVKNHLELKLARDKIERQKRRLEDQNKELIEAYRLREDIEKITRHDLKTPLNAVIGYGHLLQYSTNLDKRELEYVNILVESGYAMLSMINLSLDLFKMERGIYQFHPLLIDLVKIIDRIKKEINGALDKKQLTMAVTIDGGPAEKQDCTIWGEELLCYSMLANLLKNAVEASPAGETISIALSNSHHVIRIEIHNQGAVPESIRDRFFQKYITAGKPGGTGLGAYSAKLIAETQNGEIDFTTSEKEGTTVIIDLPRSDSNNKEKQA